MKRTLPRFCAWIALVGCVLCVAPQSRAGLLPEDILVVYNTIHPYSANVANYYAQTRNIPQRNLCGISSQLGEVIQGSGAVSAYADFTDQIEDYLLANFNPNPNDPDTYRNDPSIDPIKAIVMIHGVPSQLRYGERRGSIDAALTALFQRAPWGNLPIRKYCDSQTSPANPYYGMDTDFGTFRASNDNESAASPPNFRKVRFLSSTTALAGGDLGVLYKGQLAGQTWTWTPVNDENKYLIAHPVSDIQILSGDEAYVGTVGGTVIHTADGGDTWDMVRVAAQVTGWVCVPSIRQVSLLSQQDGAPGWFVGYYNGYNIFKGGYQSSTSAWTWSNLTSDLISDSPGKLGSNFSPQGVAAVDSSNVWICGNTGIYRSTDGGVSWTHLTSGVPANTEFYRLWMRWVTDHFEGIATGEDGCVLSTQDGTNWQVPISDEGITEDLTDLAVYPAGSGSYKVTVSGASAKSFCYDTSTGWSVVATPTGGYKSLSWTGGDDYLLTTAHPYVQSGHTSGETITWTDGEAIPAMHWKLRYLVCRLESLEDPLVDTPSDMPRDVKAMIDRSVAADGQCGENPCRWEFDGTESGYQSSINALTPIVGEENVFARPSGQPDTAMVEQDCVISFVREPGGFPDTQGVTTWGRPRNTWCNGAVVINNTNDGQSFRVPYHIWGMSLNGAPVAGKLTITGLHSGAAYTTHKAVLCDSQGNALQGGTAYFQSDGTAQIDLSGVTWPTGNSTYVEVRFPDDDPDPELRGEQIPYARSGGATTQIYDNRSAGMTFSLSCARDVTTQYIREGASGTITDIDEPYGGGLADSLYVFPRYAYGYSWAESAYMGVKLLGGPGAVLGDPLMAPFAAHPTVEFHAPTPANNDFVSGEVTLYASAEPNGTGSIDRVEFWIADTNGVRTLIASDETTPYECSWNTVGYTDGYYTIQARAYQLVDKDGVAAVSRSVTLDNENNPSVTISVPDSEDEIVTDDAPVQAGVTGTVSSVQFWLLGNGDPILAGTEQSPYQCTITSQIASDGVYYLQAKATSSGISSYSGWRRIVLTNDHPAFATVGELGDEDDNTDLYLVNVPVVAGTSETMLPTINQNMTGALYVEDFSRAAGIRVETTQSMENGKLVTIEGTLHKGATPKEQYVSASQIWDMGSAEPPSVLGMPNKSLGGAAPSGIPGIDGGVGLYNVGLLVKSVGRVGYAGNDFIYIDDGCGLYDYNDLQNPMIAPIDGSDIVDPGVGVKGVRVYFSDLPKPGIDDYVAVTGISSIEEIGTDPIYRVRLLRARTASDVTYYDQYIPARAASSYMVSVPDLTPLSAGTQVRLVDHRVYWKGTINGYTSIWLKDTSEPYPIIVAVPGEPQVDIDDIVTVTGVILADRSPQGFLQVDASEGHVYLGGSAYGAMSVPSSASGASVSYSSICSSSNDGLSGGGPFRPWPGPTIEEILASESFQLRYGQVGAIGWALSQPDGSVIDLPAEAICGEWYDGRVLGLREWFEPIPNGPRLFLYLDQPIKLDIRFRDMATIDIIGGKLATLSGGVRALVSPEAVYAYTDSTGQWMFPLPWPKFIGRNGITDGSENWPWKLKVAP